MPSFKISVLLVRSFGVGIVVFSPKLNGVCVELHVACLMFRFWNRGTRFFTARSYWNV